jgi:Holliday junction resolvase RusA-like endonuclease
MKSYSIEPMGKPRMTRRDKWKQRDCVLRYRAFKDSVRASGLVLPQPCKVLFTIPMPESWSRKKRVGQDGQPHMAKPDIDNLVKAILDSLYEDDAHVWSVWGEKRWGTTGSISVQGMEEF